MKKEKAKIIYKKKDAEMKEENNELKKETINSIVNVK